MSICCLEHISCTGVYTVFAIYTSREQISEDTGFGTLNFLSRTVKNSFILFLDLSIVTSDVFWYSLS